MAPPDPNGPTNGPREVTPMMSAVVSHAMPPLGATANVTDFRAPTAKCRHVANNRSGGFRLHRTEKRFKRADGNKGHFG